MISPQRAGSADDFCVGEAVGKMGAILKSEIISLKDIQN